jgi:hypothetical protein
VAAHGATGSGASAGWAPSGVVTLTSDFGLSEPYVGILKGVLLARAPEARIVDLSHGVPPQDVATASFFLAHSARWFPAGSVHVAVVDPGVGSARSILVAEDGGQAFLAPDNGLLGPVLSDRARVWRLDVERFALPGTGRTFHGRDVFAPAAAALVRGLAPAHCARGPVLELARAALPRARLGERGGEAEVLFADRYGNLVLSARAEDLAGDPREWRAEARGAAIPLRGTYAEASPGELLLVVDSFGALEIAVRDGDARARLGLARGDRVALVRSPS